MHAINGVSRPIPRISSNQQGTEEAESKEALFLYERRSFEDGSCMVGASRPNKLLPFCHHFGPFLPGYKSAPTPQKRSDLTLGYKIYCSFSLPPTTSQETGKMPA
ncbi:hypothetical protein D5086_025828 [Populus alba]|uniref:Uncharacterized protein n=1 Tax=Populus alba TaxID=43335 RepID=A0ACC4B0P6_POPAL